jgi:hypothetical protein
MPDMTMCTIRTACARGHVSGPFCGVFSLLADACRVDGMAEMNGCASYAALCAPGSVVPQCSEARDQAVPALVTTAAAHAAAASMCSGGMGGMMPACQQCHGSSVEACPSPLQTLAEGCWSMPDMGQCPRSRGSAMAAMCDGAGGGRLGYFCRGEDEAWCSGETVMSSGFQTTSRGSPCVVFLVQGWLLDSRGAYWLGVAASFALGAANHALFAARRRVAEAMRTAVMPAYVASAQAAAIPAAGAGAAAPCAARAGGGPRRAAGRGPPLFCVWDAILAAVYCSHVFVGYCMMLLVMTYRWELVAATVLGLGAGNAVEARMRLKRAARAAVAAEGKGGSGPLGFASPDVRTGPTPCCDGAADGTETFAAAGRQAAQLVLEGRARRSRSEALREGLLP